MLEIINQALDKESSVPLEALVGTAPRREQAEPISTGSRTGAAVDQLQYLGYRALEAFGDLVDAETLQSFAAQGAELNKEELAKYARISYDEIEGFSDASKWFLDNLIINGASIIPVVAAGATGSALGLGGLAAGSLAFLPSYIMGVGESYSKQKGVEGGNIDAGIAFGTGAIVGALDFFTPKKILNSFGIGKGFNSYLTSKLASKNIVSDRLSAGLKGLFREGSTEAMQEAVMTAAKNYVNEQDLTDFTKAEINELIEAALSGGVVGGTFGVALGEMSSADKQTIKAKIEAGATIKSDLESEVERINNELSGLKDNADLQVKTRRGTRLNQAGKERQSELKKQLKEAQKQAKDRSKALKKAKTAADVDAIFAQPESAEETAAEQPVVEQEKTLDEIMAEDRQAREVQGEIEQRANKGLAGERQPFEQPFEGVVETGTAPTPERIQERLAAEEQARQTIADRADRGEGVRDSEGNIVTPVTGGPSEIEVPAFGVLEGVDQNDLPPGVTIKDGKLTIEIGSGRVEPTLDPSNEIAQRADEGIENERPVITPHVDGEVLKAGDVLIRRADIELAKGPQRARRRFYRSPEERAEAERLIAEREEAERTLTSRAKAEVEAQAKFESAERAQAKEDATFMADDFMDFLDTNPTIEQIEARRAADIATLSDRIGGKAAVNQYRKVASRDRINKILETRSLDPVATQAQKGKLKPETAQETAEEAPTPKPTQAKVTPPAQAEPTPVEVEAAPAEEKPTQAEVTPPAETKQEVKEETKAEESKQEETPSTQPVDKVQEAEEGAEQVVEAVARQQETQDTQEAEQTATVETAATTPVEFPQATETVEPADTTTIDVGTVGMPTISGTTVQPATAPTTAAAEEVAAPERTATPVAERYSIEELNPSGVPITITQDPEDPNMNIVESQGVVLHRVKNRKQAVSLANKATALTVRRKAPREAAPKVGRPEGKTYTGPVPTSFKNTLTKFLDSDKPFKVTVGSRLKKQAERVGVDTTNINTEEELYDALVIKAEELQAAEVATQADVAAEVQATAEAIVPASKRDLFGNIIRDIPEDVNDVEAEALIEQDQENTNAVRKATMSAEELKAIQSAGLMEDIDSAAIEEIERIDAEENANRAKRKEVAEEKRLSADTIGEMEYSDLAQLIKSVPSRGGLSVAQMKTISENIKKIDPEFTYNPKAKRQELGQTILAWRMSDFNDPAIIEGEFTDSQVEDNYDISTFTNEEYMEARKRKLPTRATKEDITNTEEAISRVLASFFGSRKAREMQRIQFINIIDGKQAKSIGIDDNAIAIYASGDKKVYLIPERIATGAKAEGKDLDKYIRALVMHEVGVHAGKNIFSGQEFDLILGQINKLWSQGDPLVKESFNYVVKNYGHLDYGGRRFNEEILAHVIETKAYEIENLNKSFFNRLKDAFRKFFTKLFYEVDQDGNVETNFEADVTVDDIFNLVSGHAMRNIYNYAIARHNDKPNMVKVRTENRNNFIKDSIVKDTVFHGGKFDWSAPVLDRTELGLHVGTKAAAAERVDERFKIKEGYVNIQNPFYFSDVGYFGDTASFLQELNSNYEDGSISDYNEYKKLLDLTVKWNNIVSKIDKELGLGNLTDAEFVKLKLQTQNSFMREMRETLKGMGYDAIQYTNKQEDYGSTSYILLNDNQFKDVDSFAFSSGTNIFFDKRSVQESPEQAVAESKKIEAIAKPQVREARQADGRFVGGLKALQRGIEPLMTIKGYNELETYRMLAKGEIDKAKNTGRILFDTLYQTTKQEQKAILKYFETKDASPDSLPDRKVMVAMLPTVASGTKATARTAQRRSIKEAVIEAKKQIEKLGQDLVDLGLITNDQYQQWKGQYLPRTYLKYLGSDIIPSGLTTSRMTYTKARTATDTFLKDVMDGRISDPGFLAARYISMAGADIARIKYLNTIAADTGNNGWILPNQLVNFRGMQGTVGYWNEYLDGMRRNIAVMKQTDPDMAAQSEAVANELQSAINKVGDIPDAKGYKAIPNNARYGAMRGLYVKKEIVNDILGQESLFSSNEFLNNVLGYASKATKTFKYTKVPLNIPTQARNVISNIVLMDTSGTNFFKIPGLLSRAIEDIVNNGKYAELARKYGIETTTFASEELLNMDVELQKIKARGDGWGGMWARTQVFFNDYVDVGGRAYQKTEVMFKIAKMIDLMENHGKSESEAARLANEALLDYSNVSQGIRVIRSMPLGSPFITFNLKAAAQMVRNIRNHPIAVAKYAAIPYLVAQMLIDNNDDIDEDDIAAIKKLIPDYMEGNMTSMVLPWKDDQGRMRAFDMGYFLPWGAHLSMAKDLAEGEFGEAIKTVGLYGGPAEVPFALRNNIDPFTKQEIWNESDPPLQQFQDMTWFIASYAFPPMFMPRNKSGEPIANGGQLIKSMMALGWMDGNVDKDGLPKNTIGSSFLSWLGINTAPVTAATAQRKLYFKQKDVERILSRLKKLLDDPNITPEKRQKLVDEYRTHQMNMMQDLREYREAFSQVSDALQVR